MLGTNTSFAPFVAEEDDEVIDPGLVPAEGLADEDIIEEDDVSEELDLEADEEEEEEWDEAA